MINHNETIMNMALDILNNKLDYNFIIAKQLRDKPDKQEDIDKLLMQNDGILLAINVIQGNSGCWE